MKKTILRATALGLAMVLIGAAAPAIADEGDPAPVATLGLSEASNVLTLPAADGVRDAATLTLSSDTATTVSLDVIGTDGATVVKSLAPVELTSETLSATVTVDVAGLEPGSLSLRATPAAGEGVTAALTVGSGKPATATLSLSPKTIDTWKGSAVRSTVATVSTVDETGLSIPFTGSVTAKVGKVTYTTAVASTSGAASTVRIAATKLTAGSGSATASVTGSGTTVTSNTAAFTVRSTAVTSTKIARSATVVYPTKDGYKDSVRFSVSSKTTTGTTIPVTGWVKVINSKGKTVKSWTLESSKSWSATWNGKVGTTAVYGTYTVKAAVRGPEGSTQSASTTVTVKKGKLVDRSIKTTVKADTVLKKYVDLGDTDYNLCWHNYYKDGDVFCDGDDSIDGVSVMSVGARNVPTAVLDAQKFGGAKVKLTAKVSSLYGDAAWGYARRGSESWKSTVIEALGNSTPGWLALPDGTEKYDITLAVGEYSFVGVDTLTIEYRYRVLSTR